MTDTPATEQIENEANYWAGKVVDNIKEREEDISDKEALKTLAVLDAENNITDRMDGDDLDDFLDEFEDAIVVQEENATAIQDRADEASGKTITEGEPEPEGDTDDGE